MTEKIGTGGTPVELRVLGPLQLWENGRQHRLGSPQEQRVLAILLMAEGRAVPVDRLIDQAWDGDPPPSAQETLQSYISRLRSRLRAASAERTQLEFSSGTYTLRTAADCVDLMRFRQLCGHGRQAAERGDIEPAVTLLREAEALQRAEPLAGLTGVWAASVRELLREELREATDTRIRLELSLGRHAQLVSELRERAGRSPVVEPVTADLMVALYRCGRPEESLNAFRSARQRLQAELGLDPGRELLDLHQRVLRRDPELLLPSVPDRPRLPRLDNLLRDIPDFTGRTEEIGLLLAHLAGPVNRTALPLAVVHGMPGVGKTQLAVRVANLLDERYPDGRLYLNLGGDGHQPPLDPGSALARLLHTLELSADRLPAGLDERAALWRELMARRRAIVVLDDAHDAAQIRPLLPGTPSCSVLVTSRHRLTDLEGAWSLLLEVPSPAEASALFTRLVGKDRITDAAALRRTVALCECHPLALQLAAARLRHRIGWDIGDLADRLTQEASLLDEIDSSVGIVAAFDLCYKELDPDHRSLFRQLALHEGPDFTVGVAAALAGEEQERVHRGIDALLDNHLIEESGRDRFRLHQLLRDFGLRTGEQADSAQARQAAVRRMLDHYLVRADRADRVAHPHRSRLDVTPALAHPPSPAAEFTTPDEAEAWLDLERGNLLAAARTATTSSPEHALFFPHVLAPSFMAWGAWETAAELYATSTALARDRANRPSTGQLLVEMATLRWDQGAHEEALLQATEALEIGREQGDGEIQAQALVQLGRAYIVSGRRAGALDCLGRALDLYETAGNLGGKADTLNTMGIALSRAGRNSEATEKFRAMLDIRVELADRVGQAKGLNNIGEVLAILGRYEEARSYYDRSLALVRTIGGRQQLSNLYTNIGNVCRETGESEEALAYFRRALDSYRATGDPRGEADVLICIGMTYLEGARHKEARLHLKMGERIAERIGDRLARQQALVGAGHAQFAARQFSLSMATFQEALRAAEEIDVPLAIGRSLDGLAQVVEATEGLAAARDYIERGIDVYQRIDMPQAAQALRSRLRPPGATG